MENNKINKKITKHWDRGLRIELRIKNQFHRGGEIKEMHSGIEMYVHSKRNGKLIRDREKTIDQLDIVMHRMDMMLKNGESVIIVGTNPEVGELIERVYEDVDSSKRISVTRTWVGGMRTNYKNFQDYVLRFKATHDDRKSQAEKRWYELNRKPREGMIGRKSSNQNRNYVEFKAERPGRIRFRNPNDHVVGRKEALRCGIPTVGIVDTDCKYSERLTYVVPGNDKSRVSQLIRRRRVKEVYKKYKEENKEIRKKK